MADRVGVINHGRIVLVDEKAALMRKLGKRRLTLALRKSTLPALPKELAGWPLNSRTTATASPIASTRRPTTPAFHASAPAQRDRRRFQGSRHQHDNAQDVRRSGGTGGVETFTAVNLNGVWGALPLRDAAHAAHDFAERGDAGDHDRALFRRIRGGDRRPHRSGGRGGWLRPHSCPASMMLSLLTQNIQLVNRHLFS